ncbi:chorismate mutase [Thermoproteota archaeon]
MLKQSLPDLRKKIDTIDTAILSLLKERMDIVKQVGKLKSSEAQIEDRSETKSFMRPGREARLIRKLIKQNNHTYPAKTIISIWRNIISASVFKEQPFNVGILNSTSDCGHFIRQHFGAFIHVDLFSDISSLIDSIVSDSDLKRSKTCQIGILPYSELGKWGFEFYETLKLKQIYIFSRIPFSDEPLECGAYLALTYIDPEASGDDRSIVFISTKPGCSKETLIQSLLKQGYTARVIAVQHEQFIVEMHGFWVQNLDADAIITKSGGLITDILPLGAYAVPIKE